MRNLTGLVNGKGLFNGSVKGFFFLFYWTPIYVFIRTKNSKCTNVQKTVNDISTLEKANKLVKDQLFGIDFGRGLRERERESERERKTDKKAKRYAQL